MEEIINKTMDRSDLSTDQAVTIVEALNALITQLYSQGLYMTSWYGTLPVGPGLSKDKVRRLIKKVLGRKIDDQVHVGMDNRGRGYQPLPSSADDGRIPWYLYWEVFWVMTRGPRLGPEMRLLDAGGVSSLFTCYLASLGYEVHSIDLNKTLISNANKIAKAADWRMFSYLMDMEKLDFEDEFFDHAYSICVFEHLHFAAKQAALSEIARCLKPNGILSITFDYRNPAPLIWNCGFDQSERNQLKTEEDIRRNFLSTGSFVLLRNEQFYDNGESYLVHPDLAFGRGLYTFGAIFLMKKS